MAPVLKTVEEALKIRNRIFTSFERAERRVLRCVHSDRRQRLMHFVVVGGGPTGVQRAGAIAELTRNRSARLITKHGLADQHIGETVGHAIRRQVS